MPIISAEKIWEIEVGFEAERIEARRFTWEQLRNEVGLDIAVAAQYNTQWGPIIYHKCIACRKGWVNDRLVERCVHYANTMLQRYPEPKERQRVRFSNEVHFEPYRGYTYHSKTWTTLLP